MKQGRSLCGCARLNDMSLLQKSPIKEAVWNKAGAFADVRCARLNDRSLLQKSPIKETVFCKRERMCDVLLSVEQLGKGTICIWNSWRTCSSERRQDPLRKCDVLMSTHDTYECLWRLWVLMTRWVCRVSFIGLFCKRDMCVLRCVITWVCRGAYCDVS